MAELVRPHWHTIRFGAPEWEHLPNGWLTRSDRVSGWNVEAVPEAQKEKWQKFKQLTKGTGPLGIAHEAPTVRNDNYYAHHLIMAYAYVLALAARKKEQLTMLDWGGGIGHYLILSQQLIADLYIDYSCKEVPLLCQAGREVLTEARFFERDEEAARKQYDLVVASGSLQYAEDWRSVAQLLASCTGSYLYVTRLPMIRRCDPFVVLQRVYAYGYNTEIKCWFLNRDQFIRHMESSGMTLVREFLFDMHPPVRHAKEQAEIQGFLFKTK